MKTFLKFVLIADIFRNHAKRRKDEQAQEEANSTPPSKETEQAENRGEQKEGYLVNINKPLALLVALAMSVSDKFRFFSDFSSGTDRTYRNIKHRKGRKRRKK